MQKDFKFELRNKNKNQTATMFKFSKKIINRQLVPHLSQGSRGPKIKVGTWRIVRAIIYRLKTGVQWRQLPIKSLFGRVTSTWESVYYHFNKWSKDGSWERLWKAMLELNKSNLDMSSVELDGSQTPAKRGGEAVGYQGRKKSKTTNMLFLTDRQGIPLACSEPVSGNHNDIFEIKKCMSKMTEILSDSKINYRGLFMNADAGFDCLALRQWCEANDIIANFDFNKRNAKNPDLNDFYFDHELYKERFAVERTNAWIDGFKALLVRYETAACTWLSLHYLVFCIILLRNSRN